MGIDKKDKVKKTNARIGLIIVLLSFLLSTTAIAFFLLYRDTIYDGVTIENLDVGGLSITEAQKKIRNHFDKLLEDGKIHFVYGDKVWHINSVDIGVTYDYISAVNKAYSIGREGNYFERLQEILSLYKMPHNIILKPIYDHKKVDSVIYNIQNVIDKPPKDATIRRKNGKFFIKDEEIGLVLNMDKTKLLLAEELNKYRVQNEITVELPVETVSPRITSESLSTIHELLGEYVTKFNAGNISRTENIRLAAKAINGTVLMPKETFSFNDIVGPRTRERGYKPAKVIFKGELVEGLGGGVCQASSTLYNAVLLSNLDIIERYKHTIPSTYVPKGRDATVSYGVLDFKFENSYANPIYIESYVRKNLIIVKIYGHKIYNKTVKIVSKVNEVVKRPIEIRYDNNLLEGQERIEQKGRDGYKVTTYKIIYENGKVIERKQISKDYYKPQKQIIVKGTKKLPVSNQEKIKSEEESSPSSENY
ncbi:VanW family protein [Crassaminicella thermophila]|uniref:VanW family protein n=1 Tax=Crassaminicella thermophila TaxID=2599308 RepID=UPI00143E0A72|nr:VanW family protein [Crassaminicella thermophila]